MSGNYFITVCQIVLLLLYAASFSFAQGESGFEEVTVTGKALISVPEPKKEALKDAMRNAVETAVGVQVKSDSLAKNFQLIHDKILVRSDGYVKKWEVLKEKEEEGFYVVEMKASVGKGELNKDLFLNGIDVDMVYDWIGKPRLMVLIQEYIDEKESMTTFAQSEVESLLTSKGITVLSSEQLKNIQQRDVAMAFNDPKKAVALGNRFGADIVIVGKSISQFSRELDIAGFKQIFYTSILQAKAYRTSNAEILMSKSYTERPGEVDTSAMGKFDAAVRSIQHSVTSNSSDIVFQIVKNWFEGISKAKIYQVIISGVKSDDLKRIESDISALPNVQNVFRRSLNLDVAELEVEFAGIQSGLVAAIEKNKAVPLILTNEEPFRLSYKKKNGKKK